MSFILFSETVLQFLTTGAMEGDKAMATTPQLKMTSPSCLGFTLFLYRHRLDTVGRLRVYAYYTSENKTLIWKDSGLICIYAMCGAWAYHEVALPLGVYDIVFEATYGQKDTSSILLDDVNVYTDVCKKALPTTEGKGKFCLSFIVIPLFPSL